MSTNSNLDINRIDKEFETIFTCFDLNNLNYEEYYVALFILFSYERNITNLDYSTATLLKTNWPVYSNREGENHFISSEDSLKLNEVFKPILDKLEEKFLNAIEMALYGISDDQIVKYYPQIFEYLLKKILTKNSRKSADQILPLEISRFMYKLADLPEYAHIYNPFSGFASFAVISQEPGHQFFGQEINLLHWAIGTLRIMANRRMGPSYNVPGNSLAEWNPFISEINKRPFTYDLIIAEPPFPNSDTSQIKGLKSDFHSIEQFIIESGLNALTFDGKMLLMVPNSFLYRKSDSKFREKLIQENLIEMIISLPDNLLPHTNILTSIIVIKRFKKSAGYIRMIDARKFTSIQKDSTHLLNDGALLSEILTQEETENIKHVYTKELAKGDFNLSVQRYFLKNDGGIELNKLLTPIFGKTDIKQIVGYFIRIRDLKDDVLDNKLDLTFLTEMEVPRSNIKISESCLLIASSWNTIKPTYFEYNGSSIYLQKDVMAFQVDESQIDIDFLISELHSKYVIEQADLLRVGSIVPRLRREDFLSIKISIPNKGNEGIALQKLIVNRSLDLVSKEKGKESDLKKKIDTLETDLYEQNSYLRHTLAGPANNLFSSFKKLNMIIEQELIQKFPEIMNTKISNQHIHTFSDYLRIMDRECQRLVEVLKNQLKDVDNINAKPLKPLEILSFLESYTAEINENADHKFDLIFEFDRNVFYNDLGKRIHTHVMANEDLMRDALNNIVSNAEKHAFERDAKNRIEISLEKKPQQEKLNAVKITVSNNGKPLPKGLTLNDYSRKGAKYGINGGEGYGGWYVDQVLRKLNGVLAINDLTSEPYIAKSEFVTSISMVLIINEANENE